jgi:cysteine desulfurase
MAERTYLDWNATAPLRPEARAAIVRALELVGNPSSVHAEGRAARRIVEEARLQVARLVGAEPANVTFTSGGTEANALVLTPHIELGEDRTPRDRLLLSAIEHPSVRAGGSFAPGSVETVPCNRSGLIDLEALGRVLMRQPGKPLVAIMLANNETGVIQPIAEAARIVHATGGLLHVDAVQAAGKIPLDIKELGADLVAISAHKLGGPKGVGAVVRATQELHFPAPLIRGGGQERGIRAGTENVAAIAGFGAAAAAVARSLADEMRRIKVLRDRLEAEIRGICPDAVIFGAAVPRLPNTTLFAAPGIKAETALIALDLHGVAVSSGSACSSGKVAPSHVLEAMGVAPELARCALRVSLGFSTTEEDVARFLSAWNKVIQTLTKRGSAIAA